MAATQVCEFEISPHENRFGESVGMKIRIELGDDDDLIVTGTTTGDSEGKTYLGTLTLRPEGRGALEGGDECWVNGVWVSPCPPASEEADEEEEEDEPPDTGSSKKPDQ